MTPRKHKNAAAQLSTGDPVDAAAAELQAIRGRLHDVEKERHRVETAPIPRDVAEKRVEDYVAGAAARFRPSWGAFWQSDARNAALFQLLGVSQRPHGLPGADLLERRVESFACAVLGDEVRRVMLAGIDSAWPAGAEELTDGERASRLQQLEVEREALEILEEACIRDSERRGVALARRSDARPEIVFGDLADLDDVAA